ncbi:MAG: cation:proton antiporter, partial [Nanoarchaeota archaeon]|nr:cation:proton antiporter [Nanoarchaeota archaeon]
MDITLMFILAGFIIFLGFFGEIIFRRTKVPDALFLIIFGVIISQALHWIDPVRFNNIAAIFTTFALVFMGFEGAINLNISRIIKGLGKGTLLTFANFIISVSVVTVIGKISGFSLVNSVLLGVVLASISAEIVIPMLKSLGMREESVLSLTVESALGDVLCVLSALTIMKFINIGEFTWAAFGNNFLLYFIISVIIGIILGILWVFFLKLMENISRSYMITIACMVLLFGIVEYFGYDGAFSCLAFGLVLGNSEIFLKVLKKQDYTFKITPNQKFFFSQISFFMK